MQSKLHRKLDAITVRRERAIERIERDEIKAYADDLRYSELEELKKKALAIRFLEK